MIDRRDLFPIGIGTWGLGGFMDIDPATDEERQVNAVSHMFNSGMNFVEVNLWYSQGYSAKIVKRALDKSDKKRSDVFICQAIYLKAGNLEDAETEIDLSLKLFDTDFVDTFQFTKSVFDQFGFEETVKFTRRVLASGKSRYTSITNEDLNLLKNYHKEFGNTLFSHEVCFNLEVRENETLGMIPYANKNDLLTVVYQPLRRNRTANQNWSILAALAKKYGVTQNQILMKWVVSKGYLPLTKSETVDHINEHLKALTLKIDEEDLEKLDHFSPPGYTAPVVDWDKSGVGVSIDQMSNIFDEEYQRQQDNSV